MRGLRWLVVPILVLPLGWVLFTGIGRDPREVPSPLIGRPMPEFSLVSLDGRRVTSEELCGRPVLINFWASWCVPACVDEHPVLLQARERHGDDLAMVGILYEDRVEDAREFLARHGDGGWPNLIDTDGAVAIDFGVTGPPETFLVDAEAVVRYRHFGPLTEEVLERELARLSSRAGAAAP